MDDNRITSTDFDYDAYTGGSSSSDSSVTSSDFNYDVYSGQSAMEYLRQENERKAEERKRAQKTEAELRREEYEKKFAGMSADDLFGMPDKKKKPEDDFSDFFDADEIERQRQKVREFENEKKPEIKVETMMPGEDDPSSETETGKQQESVQDALEMMAREKYRRDQAMEHYRDYRGRIYYGGRYRHGEYYLIKSLLGRGNTRYGEYDDFDRAVTVYLIAFVLGALLGGFLSGMRIGIGLICGAAAGAVASFVRRNGVENQPFGEAISNTRLEIIGIAIAAVVGLILEFA